jgi:outer membrane protein assembly factor BamB
MCGLTWDGRLLWHSDQGAQEIFAVDPQTGEVVRKFPCAEVRADLTFAEGDLWQVGGRPKRLLRIDPYTGDIRGERTVRPSSGRLCGVEAGPEGRWMCLRSPAVVQLRDLDTLGVQHEVPVVGQPSGLTYARGVVLYSDFEDGLVRAVNPATGALLAEADVEGHPVGMTFDGIDVWYCDFAARRFKAFALADLLPAVDRRYSEPSC